MCTLSLISLARSSVALPRLSCARAMLSPDRLLQAKQTIRKLTFQMIDLGFVFSRKMVVQMKLKERKKIALNRTTKIGMEIQLVKSINHYFIRK